MTHSGPVRIVKVENGWGGPAKGFLFHSGMHPGDSNGLAVYSDALVQRAKDAKYFGSLVRLEIIEPASGHPYVRALHRMETPT